MLITEEITNMTRPLRILCLHFYEIGGNDFCYCQEATRM